MAHPRDFDDFLAGLDLTEPASPPAELDVSYRHDEQRRKRMDARN